MSSKDYETTKAQQDEIIRVNQALLSRCQSVLNDLHSGNYARMNQRKDAEAVGTIKNEAS
jgi:hypothetical protein